MNILITGGAGFIGCSLANRLMSDNYNITIVDRLSEYYSVDYKKLRLNSQMEKTNYFFAKTDINQDEISELFSEHKFYAVVHLAAQPGVRVKFPQSINYLKDNISGFSKILTLSIEHNVSKFIYASSSSVYQNSTSNIFIEDAELITPKNLYAKTKWINEQIATEFIGKSSTRILGLRLFSVYGPWGRPDMAPLRIIASCLTDYRFLLNSDGNTRRDFTFISDVTNLIYELISLEELPEGVLNIGAGNDHSINEMIDIVRKISGLDPKIDHNSEDLKEIIRTKSDTNKLKKILGDFSYTPLEIGMSKTFEWAKSPEIKSNLEKWVASV
jgi:UDP-glucuronate 4-epimerase